MEDKHVVVNRLSIGEARIYSKEHNKNNLATSCTKTASSNNKWHIKWVEYGTTDFLLFWLHLASQSSEILSFSSYSLATDVNKL